MGIVNYVCKSLISFKSLLCNKTSINPESNRQTGIEETIRWTIKSDNKFDIHSESDQCLGNDTATMQQFGRINEKITRLQTH